MSGKTFKTVLSISQTKMNKIYIFKTNTEKSALSSIAYSLLSELLEKDLGIKNPKILKTEKGKPYLEGNANIHFNISHTKGAVAIAFSDNEIGIDIEHIRKTNTKIANRFFCEGEAAFLENVKDKNAEFLKMWTRKEAYIKMLGHGISSGLNSFNTLNEKIAKKIKTFKIEGFYISVCCENTAVFEIITRTI